MCAVYAMCSFASSISIAWANESDTELLCHAHKHNVRLISAANRPEKAFLNGSEAAMVEWVRSTVARLSSIHFDGVTFDYEAPMDPTDTHTQMKYAELVKRTKEALAKERPGSQVSVCVPWSPYDIDQRSYDWRALADAADFLYVMAYDIQSQILSRCIAQPNSPIEAARYGLNAYMRLSIPPSSLVLGVPFYGYVYGCFNTTIGDTPICAIEEDPFRSVACSDAAGSQWPFRDMYRVYSGELAGVCVSGVHWDEATQSPWFNFYSLTDTKLQQQGENKMMFRRSLTPSSCSATIQPQHIPVRQAWFDSPRSIRAKVRMAKDMGLRGVGPFAFDQLLPRDGAQIKASPGLKDAAGEFWGALGEIRQADAMTATGQ